ncbi:MAG: hypothetical protein KUG65_07970 [Sphingomonadaceae bacterium]|nr:hypothetical protein [Sphingomonadaceae bacterium]
MVNYVVERDQLAGFALESAVKIASKPSFALKLTKEPINKTLDIQGQANAIDAAFTLHHLSHTQNFRVHGWRRFQLDRAVVPVRPRSRTLSAPIRDVASRRDHA